MIQFDKHIFQMGGWFNHQLDKDAVGLNKLDVDWQAIIAAAPVLTNGEAMGLVMFGDTFQQSTSTNTQKLGIIKNDSKVS